LGPWLDLQPGAVNADDGGVDVHGAGLEVECRIANGAGFADACAGAEHELHEVGQVESDSGWVGPKPGDQVSGLADGESPNAFAWAGDRLGVAHRIDPQGAVSHGAVAQA